MAGPSSGQSRNEFDASLDALSDVLDLIHLRGESLTVIGTKGSANVRHEAGERLVHLIRAGSVGFSLGRGTQATLAPGDAVLLPTGSTHGLTSADPAEWMTGRFSVDEVAAGPLLGVLPSVLVVRAAEAELRWIPLAGELLAMEMADPNAGSRVMVSRLLDLVFIQALRAWAAGDASGADPGWLTAALDRQLGPALRAIHRQPEQPWSVQGLAELSSMSRAAFAARFTQKVGQSPSRYLSHLRLGRAASQLRSTSMPVAAVGRAVGYGSEAAFSRAFSREYGMPPRAWRAAGPQSSVSAKKSGFMAIPPARTSPIA